MTVVKDNENSGFKSDIIQNDIEHWQHPNVSLEYTNEIVSPEYTGSTGSVA